MEKLVLISVLLGLVCGSDVIDLSGGLFEAEISQHDLMLVEFFAPWCGHCKRLAPEYETAATTLKRNDPPVPLAKVDCTDDAGGKDTCSKYGVSGYPTLKIFRNGDFSSEYDGPRSADGIVSTMKKQSGPMAKEVSDVKSLQKILDNAQQPVVVGFFSKEGKEKENLVKAASNLFTNYKVVYSLSEEVNKEFGHTHAVVLFRPVHLNNKFEDNKVEMSAAITRANIEKFAGDNSMGLCGHMTPDNQDLFKKPQVVAYYKVDYKQNPKGTNYYRNRVMKVAKNYKDEGLTFAIASKSDFSGVLESMDIKSDDDVKVVAWQSNGEKFKMEEAFTNDGKALDAFVKKFLAGEIKPFIKSEPAPASNDGPVKVVVGSTFNDIVKDDTKDVLIEFYAPWCGHCKSLEPKYTELGEKLKDVEHVVIAKMDATANDSPAEYAVSGFPTIYWAPMGSKSDPKKYQGGREVDDFIKFIKKESTKPVNVGKKKKSKTDEL
ncbi:protein disulfide-isomerase A3-like [Acanthaster planci]|uniref:Protein disulfide-isomerase n=1 Tax=Acanthaster planci TaxID=133434 RepID=A0A8B7ZRG4_ACAPL|nr:protein disulfide-isomerase A3-like [Acanthaster planci]